MRVSQTVSTKYLDCYIVAPLTLKCAYSFEGVYTLTHVESVSFFFNVKGATICDTAPPTSTARGCKHAPKHFKLKLKLKVR